MLWLYLTYSFSQIYSRKKTYIFGLIVLIIASASILILVSLASQTTLVLFRCSEIYNEESDVVVKPNDPKEMFNHTLVSSKTQGLLSTPRYESSVTVYSFCNTPNITALLYENYPKCNWDQQFCVNATCFSQMQTDLVVFDTNLERAMGFGRDWNFPAIPYGSIYITQNYAEIMKLRLNDTLVLQVLMGGLEQLAIAMNMLPKGYFDDTNRVVWLSLRISGIIRQSIVSGKSGRLNPIFIELRDLTTMLKENVHPALQSIVKQVDSFHYVPQVHFSLNSRIDLFRTKRYNAIRSLTIEFASKIAYLLGFDQISQQLPLVQNLEKYQVIETYTNMGVILSIILIDFTAAILVHSLFMINIESKTFHNGILRSLGLRKISIYILVVCEFLWYAVPGFVFGFIVGFIGYTFVGNILADTYNIPFSNVITGESCCLSLVS
jgi:hypothetical protein